MFGRRRRCSHFSVFFSTSKVDVMDRNTITFLGIFFFHSRTVYLDIIRVFIYQLMHKRTALK